MDRKTQKLLTAFEEKARALGFDGVKIAAADSIPEAGERLRHFLDKGYEGSMGWMAETADRRSSPQALWPEVRSVIMLAMNYGPGSAPHEHPLAHLADKTTGGISVYARHRDYHDVIKGRLKELASFLVSRSGGDVKVFVDTAPVMEKPLGEASGLGWQGKHTNLGVTRSRVLVFPRLDLHHTGSAAERRGTRSLRLLPRLPRQLPDERISRALSARCEALHFLPHHRTPRPHSGRVSQSHRQPNLRL